MGINVSEGNPLVKWKNTMIAENYDPVMREIGNKLRGFRHKLALAINEKKIKQSVFGEMFGTWSERQISSYESGDVGWTVLGWIAALIWAVAEKEEKRQEVAAPHGRRETWFGYSEPISKPAHPAHTP